MSGINITSDNMVTHVNEPSDWKQKGVAVGEDGSEVLFMHIGEHKDSTFGVFDFDAYVRKSTYEGLMSGKYSISKEKTEKVGLTILDKLGVELCQVGGGLVF